MEEQVRWLPDGTGGGAEASVPFPIWLEPRDDGMTPVCQAYEAAYGVAERWCGERPTGHPPIVVNVTGGIGTDRNWGPITERIAELRTTDGNVTLLNCHIATTGALPVRYPVSARQLPERSEFPIAAEGEACELVFHTASYLPDAYVARATCAGAAVSERSVGFLLNAGFLDLWKLLV
jgi:hypothetical protein